MNITPTVRSAEETARDRSVPERLIHFAVDGLFDEFTYRIPLGNEDRITAIIAPNGSGKTLCLRLINAFFGKKWSYFTDVLFARVEFTFRSGRSVSIEKYDSAPTEDKPAALGIRVVVKELDGTEQEWIPGVLRNLRTHAPIESYLPYLTRTGPNIWTHDATGEPFTLQKIFEEYGDELPDSLRRSFFSEAPTFLLNFVNAIDCHLIETQRLLILREDDESLYRHSGRRPASTLAISRKAQTLRTIISKSLTNYAALSQSLDRSFPRRVIAQQQFLPSENLKKQLQELDEQRHNLMAAGILDTEADDPVSLPEGPMAEAISRVLSVYADDTRSKLSSLSTLLARIQLFKELISQRFVSKIVSVSKEGFEVTYHKNKVPLEKLSSGEQHQLVLFFELLFELKENALILIDEPELSLHVAWQKKFISDLKKIIALNRFDVILATHSPQLIGRWNNLVVELGGD